MITILSPRIVRSVPITETPVCGDAAGSKGDAVGRAEVAFLPIDGGGGIRGLISLSGLELNMGPPGHDAAGPDLVQTPLSKWHMTVRRYFVGRTTCNQRTPVVITTMIA